MMTFGTWARQVESGNACTFRPPLSFILNITQAVLDVSDQRQDKGRYVVTVETSNHEGKMVKYVVCVLRPRYKEQVQLQLLYSWDAPVTFSVSGGRGVIHLSGFLQFCPTKQHADILSAKEDSSEQVMSNQPTTRALANTWKDNYDAAGGRENLMEEAKVKNEIDTDSHQTNGRKTSKINTKIPPSLDSFKSDPEYTSEEESDESAVHESKRTFRRIRRHSEDIGAELLSPKEEKDSAALDFTSCYLSPQDPHFNAACTPVPRTDNADWHKAHRNLVAEVMLHAQGVGPDLNFLFLGDSIIERLRGTRFGKPNHWLRHSNLVWKQTVAPLGSLALGISGDGTQHLLWRLQNGELPPNLKAKVVVLLIGTNNVYLPNKFNPHNYDFSAEDIASAIREIAKYIHQTLPSCKLLILGLLPRGKFIPSQMMSKIIATNKLLQQFVQKKGENLHFLDCSSVFLNQIDGQINATLMKDFLHPTAEGYKELFSFLLPTLQQIQSN